MTSEKPLNFGDFLTVDEAARELGIHKHTLRRWTESKKITFTRHPINNYRLFRKSDLEKLLKELVNK